MISVLLPVRDAAATLAAAVASILAQTERDLELVIVDDGSRDGSGAVAERVAADDARVRVLHRPASGIVAALSAALAVARGTLIARMDADDWSHPERLARQRALLDARPGVGLVATCVALDAPAGAAEGYRRYVAWSNALRDHDAIARERFVECPVIHPSIAFRADIARTLGAWREGAFPEDYELVLRWLDAGVTMARAVAGEPLLHWRDAPSRLSRVDLRYSPDAFYRLKARFLARWLARHNAHHPEVIVWGAGRPTRRRAEHLLEHGVRIAAWVDIDPRKTGHVVAGVPVIRPDELPAPGDCFVVSYVGRRGARESIRAELERRGHRVERDWIAAA